MSESFNESTKVVAEQENYVRIGFEGRQTFFEIVREAARKDAEIR